MKTKLIFIFLLALIVNACGQKELIEERSINGRTFTASIEDNSTRTYVENGKLLRWTEGDHISLFDGNTLNSQYKFDGKTGDNAGTFSIVEASYGTGNNLTVNYAIYPYDSEVTISDNGVITATLPSEQSYANNSFGIGANTMVAVTQNTAETFLNFKNVCGYLKLQLYGDEVTVKSITLTGNNNEKLTGTATITPVYGQEPTISMANDATGNVTLNCINGIKIGSSAETATAFWIVIPPTTFENGFKVTITDVDDNKMTQSTSKEISIKRNMIQPMAALKVETVKTIPNNQIWYTSSDGNIVTPNATNVFGAEIESNVYNKGKGIITFKNDVKSIGNYAFKSCKTLTSITIPNSVTYIGNQTFRETALINIEIPNSVTSLGDAFNNCSSLVKVSLPDGLTEIPSQLFYNCKSLTDVIIPNGVTKIGQSSFYGCSSLSAITIPNNVTTIQKYAFHTTGIINFTFPNRMTNIEAYSVYNCPALESITIPASVKTIEGSAFFANNKLKTVRIYAVKPPTIINTSMYGTAIFYGNTLTTCVLEVPKGLGTTYYNATGWAFSTIREIQ